MRRSQGSKGQSTAEYAIVIALVLGAVVGMQTYVRRAINARVADASDGVLPDTQLTANAGTRRYQFEPNYSDSDFTTQSQLGTAAAATADSIGPGSEATVTLSAGAGGISDVRGNYGSRTEREGTQIECAVGVACP